MPLSGVGCFHSHSNMATLTLWQYCFAYSHFFQPLHTVIYSRSKWAEWNHQVMQYKGGGLILANVEATRQGVSPLQIWQHLHFDHIAVPPTNHELIILLGLFSFNIGTNQHEWSTRWCSTRGGTQWGQCATQYSWGKCCIFFVTLISQCQYIFCLTVTQLLHCCLFR